jgi:muramoyltetrapeptide carboxypeptidase
MIIPPYLKPGDRVGIVSSAKRTSPGEIEQGMAMLESWGLVPVMGKYVFSGHGFFAGTDKERTDDLQAMLDDVSIKAVFFTKGAYGTLRIIDGLDFTNFKTNPKWVVGYSDITILHSHIHNFNIATLHAVMLQGIPKSLPESTATMKKALFGEHLVYEIAKHNENRDAREIIEGELVGGNLSIFYALTGSPSEIDTEGKILFIEDIDEYLYHLDRMMISLKRGGRLSALKAVIVGGMVDIKESTIPFGMTYHEIILENVPANCPVFFGFPSGHMEDNRALVMGKKISIEPFEKTIKIDFL